MENQIKFLLYNATKYILDIFSVSKEKKELKPDKVLSGKFLGKNYHMANGATLTIKNSKENKEKIDSNIEKIAKKYIKNPNELFEYIKSKGTPVYLHKYANKLLSLIGEKEGFIYPKKGIKAIYLNMLLNKKISSKTDEMFVLRSYNTVECVLLYQFYNWYCFKNKLTGYETKTQDYYKNVFKICSSTELLDNLSFEELMSLKSAVRRDIEAIEFVEKYMTENKIAKKKLENLKTGKLVKI